MKLTNGVFWPIPITLSVDSDLADSIRVEEEVALVEAESGEILAVMAVREKYAIDKTIEAEHVYRTTDPKHPGVAKLFQQGDVNLAGPVFVLSEGEYPVKISETLHPSRAGTGDVFGARLVDCRCVSDPKSHAPQPRTPGQNRG